MGVASQSVTPLYRVVIGPSEEERRGLTDGLYKPLLLFWGDEIQCRCRLVGYSTRVNGKMLCHITRPDWGVMEVECDPKANGEDCRNKVK